MGACLSCFKGSSEVSGGKREGSGNHLDDRLEEEIVNPVNVPVDEPPVEVIEAVRLTPEEVKKATNKWTRANLIGTGPSGEVYKGTVQNRVVAVKKLSSNSQIEDDFIDEVELVKKFKSAYVVQLVAYCPDAGHRALAFEYAPFGSLSDLLHGKRDGTPVANLTWLQRLKILQGAAQGLEYLHNRLASEDLEGLVHKRVKTSNVLVFKGYVGKISDCKMQPQDQDSILMDSSLPLGPFAAEAPEAFTGELTQKSDVFSFGIVLLEVLCGRPAMQFVNPGNGSGAASRQRQSLKEWALGHISRGNLREMVDSRLRSDAIPDKVLQRYCKMAKLCLDMEPSRRLDMLLISKSLARLLTLSEEDSKAR